MAASISPSLSKQPPPLLSDSSTWQRDRAKLEAENEALRHELHVLQAREAEGRVRCETLEVQHARALAESDSKRRQFELHQESVRAPALARSPVMITGDGSALGLLEGVRSESSPGTALSRAWITENRARSRVVKNSGAVQPSVCVRLTADLQ